MKLLGCLISAYSELNHTASIGVSKQHRNWYRSLASYLQQTNPSALATTPTPILRAQLMDRILELGKGH